MMDLPEGLSAQIEMLPDAPGCWLWSGSVNPQGYGLYGSARRRERRAAHRAVYELVKGPIPEGLTLDHKCRVRSCVNPEHMDAVPIAENIQRAPRVASGLCKRGHPIYRIYVSPTGKQQRVCTECGRERVRKHRAKDPSHVNAQARARYYNDIERSRAYQRQWHQRKRDALKEP
jgi:hypothetical protein